MTRVNVSIPDELYEAVKTSRPRINVSKACRDALGAELAKRTPPPESIGEVSPDLVRRLAAEKVEYERDSMERGYRTGLEWAEAARYPELRRWGRHEVDSLDDLNKLVTPPMELAHEIYELSENFGMEPDEKIRARYPGLRHVSLEWVDVYRYARFYFDFGDKWWFNKGFLDAVRRIWQLVEPQLQTSTEQ